MKVRLGSTYKFDPNGWDTLDPKTNAKPGDLLTVVQCRGCPKPNTMNSAHVADENGKFLGLVSTGSLYPKDHVVGAVTE